MDQRAFELGKNIERRETPSIPPRPRAKGPPHLRNYSLGAFQATALRPPIVTPVAKAASNKTAVP